MYDIHESQRLTTVDSGAYSNSVADSESADRFATVDPHAKRRSNASLESYHYEAYQAPPPAPPPPPQLRVSHSNDDVRGKKNAPERPLSRANSSSFLGADMRNSNWLKWSQDRRASFKRRLDALEKRQKELEENRVSTPVMKARKESVMFSRKDVTDLEAQEDALQLDAKLLKYMPASAIRKRGKTDVNDNKLSMTEWNALVTYWEHGLFVKFRYIGIVLAIVAFVAALVTIASQEWSVFESKYP